MSQPDEIGHDELMDLVADEIDKKFGEANDSESDVNDADLEVAPDTTPEVDAAEAESDMYAMLISDVVEALLQATNTSTPISKDAIVHTLGKIADSTTASALLPVTLKNMHEKFSEEELVEVLDYFAYRCSPFFGTDDDVDRDNLSVQTRRFLNGEMEWSEVTPIEKVRPTLPEENDDLVSIEDLAKESGLAPTDVIEIAGLDPIDKDVCLTTKISKFNFLLNAHKFGAWCEAVKAQEAAETEKDPKPQPPMPDDADRSDDVDDDELAASTVAGRLGLKYTDVLQLAGVTTNADGTEADGLSKVSLNQVSSEFEQVCAWVAAVKAETKPKPEPMPAKIDEKPTRGETEVDKAKAEAGQDTSKKPFDHAEDDDEFSHPAPAPKPKPEEKPFVLPSVADLINIDPDDPLTEFEDDWFVTNCNDLTTIIKK